MGLKENHPDLFEKAKGYEYANKKNGNPFYWNGDEPLEELEKPERIEEIKHDWMVAQANKKRHSKNLVQILGDMDNDEEEEREGCLICQI